MAVRTANLELLWLDGRGERQALFRLNDATAADTADFAAWFSRVKAATVLNVSRSEALAAPAIAGTVLTFNEVGLADDAILVLVSGAAA